MTDSTHGTPEFHRGALLSARAALAMVQRTFAVAGKPLNRVQRAWLAQAVRSLANEAYGRARDDLLSSVDRAPGLYNGFKVVESSSGESLSLAVLRDKHPEAYQSLLDSWSRNHTAAWADSYTPDKPRMRLELPASRSHSEQSS